tara:strand:- start:4247 stop:4756 length:510 start_codon:yes stop_codon:yes gene_type:complete
MSDSKIQRAKKQCEKLKEMADEYWEMFEEYHKMELELERVKEIRIQLRGEKDKQWEQKKQAQEELERVKEQNNELKELNVALRRECDTEHIRYINAREEAYDNMWEVAGALDINWSGQRNKDIIDAIKKSEEEKEKYKSFAWKMYELFECCPYTGDDKKDFECYLEDSD